MAESASAAVSAATATASTTPWRAAWHAQQAQAHAQALAHAQAIKAAAASASASQAIAAQYAAQQQTASGLPVLPPHAQAPVLAEPAPLPTTNALGRMMMMMTTTDVCGEVADAKQVRAVLQAQYERTGLLEQMSEMTLRIDTEMELLRRQCFAERNAQWGYDTPEMFEYVPAPTAVWDTWTQLYGTAMSAVAEAGAATVKGESGPDALVVDPHAVGVFVRDRPWPPKEFVVKQNQKPSRARANKRKVAAAAPVEITRPTHSKMCCVCQQQSATLWRKRPRAPVISAQPSTEPSTTTTSTTTTTTEAPEQPPPVAAPVEDDICNTCFLKSERVEIFERKRAEKLAKQRAAEQALELKIRREEEQRRMREEAIRKELREVEAALKRKDKKKAKKEKKEKKDKKKKKKRLKREDGDDHDDDDDSGDRSPSLSPMPSPPQYTDGFVYADGHTQRDVEKDEVIPEMVPVKEEPAPVPKASSSSKKKKKPASKRASKDATSTVKREPKEAPSASVKREPRESSSRKRSASSISADTTDGQVAVAPAATSASRTPRSRATTTTTARKRARTKKETAREKELRALGQYCPVCNQVYEEDDDSSFVCCDSCEMWVHGACDPELNPASIAALANSNESYICPLCGGR
ncbi:TPA: hypothetical protein N0F65_012322 [Lagenidium giganteum]|uniref:PHD-type domain-containing protein n=1 Tax=Lagenidium giganteum TaxID=4803 RepID=A0AAV2YRY1_9STRA|nr:TPA: hypothetical protein N0F65_012322 [Lagenidium giganteum]